MRVIGIFVVAWLAFLFLMPGVLQRLFFWSMRLHADEERRKGRKRLEV